MKFRNYIQNIFALLIITVVITSCEDRIYPKLEDASSVLVVDAWINNKAENQVIMLTKTQPYFENSLPPGVSGATVTVTDNDGKAYSFIEDDNTAGDYVWKPQSNETFGTVGKTYTLSVQVDGETFTSISKMGRVPQIDSITFDEDDRPGRSPSDKDPFYRAEFWSTDPAGAGDTYWIRTYKNGILLDKPSEINIAYDAGNAAGADADGVTFIVPIRRGINANDKDPKDDTKTLSPIEPGDSLNVQINSISVAAFNYLNEVATQTDRPGGFSELFATPLANVSTNISNENAKGSPVLGFFNVASVSTAGQRFKLK